MKVLMLTPREVILSVSCNGVSVKSEQVTICRVIIPEIGVRVFWSRGTLLYDKTDRLCWSDHEVVVTAEATPEFLKHLDSHHTSHRQLIEHIEKLRKFLEQFIEKE